MLKLFLWFRYLRERKIALLSIAAVALSVSLLTIVSSLFTGFIRAFEQSAAEAMGDVVLAPAVRFARYPELIEQLEKTAAVQAATATLSTQGLLHLGRGNVRAVRIWGIQPGRRAKVTGFKQTLRNQRNLPGAPSFSIPDAPDKIGGFVGVAVIAEPDEQTDEYDFSELDRMLGSDAVLTTGAVSGTEEKDNLRVKRRTLKFAIADVVFTGVYYLDKNYVYLPIEQLQKELYPDERYPVADQLQIKIADGISTDSALAQIRGVWEIFATDKLGWSAPLISYTDIETSQQMQSRYVAELMKQMGVLLLIFGVVSFGVVLLVFCIFYMIARLKQKDVAIMKSCGATSTSVAMVFVGFGGCVGIAGAALGTVIGYAVTKNINTIEGWIRVVFGLKLWKSSVYMFSKIPNEVNWNWLVLIVFSAVVAVAVGALIPAIIAARTRPVNILRYE